MILIYQNDKSSQKQIRNINVRIDKLKEILLKELLNNSYIITQKGVDKLINSIDLN